ncbi:spore protease YyaC [Bacillus timonensis]|nr:spore protease YyaC [Bacillus timonensis]
MNLKPNFFDKSKEDSFRFPYDEEGVHKKLAFKLSSLLPSTNQPIVFVCIGTDRSTGDSLGPLVGSILEEKRLSHFHVYGTLEEPIHAVNLVEKLNGIKQDHHNPFIFGIDACLGRLKSVGVITIGEGPLKPGAGVNKELLPVGDAHITGIVNVSGFMEFLVLQNTRLNLVMKMAKTISNSIEECERLFLLKDEVRRNTYKNIHTL